MQFPPADFPDFDGPCDPAALLPTDIEAFATRLRRFWGLGDGPISNVVALLENHGAVVARNELGDERLDAFSEWDGGRCFIILGSDKESAVRSRLDVCHELAHMLLHRNVPENLANQPAIHKLMEWQATRFASAFLLPATTFSAEVYAASAESLISLKRRWRVSVAAMVMRLSDMGRISDLQKSHLMIQISRRGWRKREPFDDQIPAEQPLLLRRSVDLLLEQGLIQAEELVLRTHYSQADIEKLLGLTVGYLNEPSPPLNLGLRIAT